MRAALRHHPRCLLEGAAAPAGVALGVPPRPARPPPPCLRSHLPYVALLCIALLSHFCCRYCRFFLLLTAILYLMLHLRIHIAQQRQEQNCKGGGRAQSHRLVNCYWQRWAAHAGWGPGTSALVQPTHLKGGSGAASLRLRLLHHQQGVAVVLCGEGAGKEGGGWVGAGQCRRVLPR